MTRSAHRTGHGRRRLIGLTAGAGFVLLTGVHLPLILAQAAPEISSQRIEDTWQGTLHVQQHDLRIVTKISRDGKGSLKVVNYSIDQGGQPLPANTASFEDKTLKYSIDMIDGKYEGKMSADGKSISGTWTQGPNPLPLLFERATPETAWAIPEPPPRLPPMPADADPNFEVATVKPSNPDQPGKGFRWRGADFSTVNTTLDDLIKFAYNVQEKQLIGGPDWMHSTKFDITAKPDIPGTPSETQLKSMLQKLLADRFQLKFHRDKKELSAYVLSVAKGGPKMTKETDEPNNGLPSMFFRGLGVLPVHNAKMGEFANLLQSAVLDRPVVDRTGLDGRWDFLLKWTPDESQFGGMGIKIPQPSDAADAPPPLFTAIQEQIGLKLEAQKASVEVLVLDHVEQPSAN